MVHRGFDPETFPGVLFTVAVGAHLLFIAVTLWAMRVNHGEARSPRLHCRSAACAATHLRPVGVSDSGAAGPRTADHLAIRRSFKVFAVATVAGLVAALAFWAPVGSAALDWSSPFRFAAYVWWSLPFGLGSIAVWTVMVRADRRPLRALR